MSAIRGAVQQAVGRAMGLPWTRRWSVLDLFRDGQTGIYFDPEGGKLYVDTAGVTRAGDNDIVKLWRDSSPNENDATQEVTASAPRLEQDAQGNWFVRFDGSDDFLTASGLVLTQPATIILAASVDAGSGAQALTEGAGDALNRFIIRREDTGIRMWAGSFVTNSAGMAIPSGPLIITAVFNGVNSRIRVNSNAWSEGDAGSNNLTEGLRIGAHHTGDANFHNGKTYGTLIRSGILTDNEIVRVENHFAEKAGITL